MCVWRTSRLKYIFMFSNVQIMQNYNQKENIAVHRQEHWIWTGPCILLHIWAHFFSSVSVFFFSASLSLSPAERRGLQYEHPHARPPSEFLSGHSFPGPEGCWAAGEAHFRTWCGLLTNGYAGEPLAAYSDSCKQEEGKERRVQYCKAF